MLLSIIVPIYKIEESYFRECLDSLVAIESDDVEIILVDDGSPDNCGAICDEYAEKDARIRVLHKENAGVSAARNDGIRMATGKYITFVDADDWISEKQLSQVIESLSEEGNDLVAFDSFEEDRNCTITISAFSENKQFLANSKKEMLLKMVLGEDQQGVRGKQNGLSSVWSKIYKREFVKNNAIYFNESLVYGEDTVYMFLAISAATSIEFNTTAFYHYRLVDNSVCHVKKNIGFDEVTNFYRILIELIAKNKLGDDLLYTVVDRYYNNLSYRYSCRWDIGKSAIGTFFEKSKAIRREYKKEPFKTAVKQIRYSNYHFKGKTKVFLFKAHFPELFLLMKWVQGKVKRKKLY